MLQQCQLQVKGPAVVPHMVMLELCDVASRLDFRCAPAHHHIRVESLFGTLELRASCLVFKLRAFENASSGGA